MKNKKKFLMISIPLLPATLLGSFITLLIASDFLTTSKIYNFHCIVSAFNLNYNLLLLAIPFFLLQLLLSIKKYSSFLKSVLTFINTLSISLTYCLILLSDSIKCVPCQGGIDSKYFGWGLFVSCYFIIPMVIILFIIGIILLVKFILLLIQKKSIILDRYYIQLFLIVLSTIIVIQGSFNIYYLYEKSQNYDEVNTIISSDKSFYGKLVNIFEQVENLHLPNFTVDYETCHLNHKINTFIVDHSKEFKEETIYISVKCDSIEYSSIDNKRFDEIIVSTQGRIIRNISSMSNNEASDAIKRLNREVETEILNELK